ncbi:efflux RND transporter permease subunit, partial [candidate division WOR-3 bacterium]|nr:efflux RND transporter permease subunit [candidate division WOR-3 bacterium]
MIKGSVKRPILTTVIFVILIIIGAVSLKSLPIDLYPNIEMPMISILTTYPGASAEDVEKQISKPLEDFLGSISNMKKITSTSQENLSVVTLEFDYGTDLTEATNDVRDALDFAKMTLPADADQPRLLKFSSSMMPIILGSIKAENPGVDLRKVMDEKISKMIGRVDGVGAVSLWGGIREMQVKIKIDKTKIENLDVSLQQIMGIVRANNFDIPAGNVRKGEKEFSVRVPGEFNSIDQIENLIVGFSGKSPIYLKDIADVTFEPAERINYVRLNGKPSAIFMVTKQSGANSIKVANSVVEEIKKINKEIPGVQLNVLVNNAESIVSSIRNLSMTILFAIIL